MTTNSRKTAKNHDEVLEEIAAALDIPPSKFEEAKSRYESVGAWLNRDDSSLAGFDPAISPQGSFLLGTVTRPLSDTEEYDVDLVCLLKASKTDFSQKKLKEDVGAEVALYAKANNMSKPLEEKRRCWTLNYADGAQFHMDILPALPDAQRYQTKLTEQGYDSLAQNQDFTGSAIGITDKTLPQYTHVTEDWPQSNPDGYAKWFRSRMTVQLNEQKRALAEREMIRGSVDEIPDYKVKTPLQRAIQLLKRHRDCMFADDGEHKPISIIITTLSAHAYNEEATISEALSSILKGMDQYIEHRADGAWVVNPVNPAENFADKWAEEPKKREYFDKWLEQARQDFANYLRGSSFDSMPEVLKENLGYDLVDQIFNAVIPAAVGLAAPAIAPATPTASGVERVEAAISELQRSGAQSKPWSKY